MTTMLVLPLFLFVPSVTLNHEQVVQAFLCRCIQVDHTIKSSTISWMIKVKTCMMKRSSRIRAPRWLPVGNSYITARPGCDSQDGVSQQQQSAPLFVPHLDRLYEANLRGEDASNAVDIPLSTGSHSKSSHGGNRLKTSSRDLRSHVPLNSFAFTHNSV